MCSLVGGASKPERRIRSVASLDLSYPKTGQRPNIVAAIKAYGTWAKLSESSYAIVTTKSPQDVYTGLSPLLDNNDHLSVITLNAPWWSKHSQEVLDWLQQNVT